MYVCTYVTCVYICMYVRRRCVHWSMILRKSPLGPGENRRQHTPTGLWKIENRLLTRTRAHVFRWFKVESVSGGYVKRGRVPFRNQFDYTQGVCAKRSLRTRRRGDTARRTLKGTCIASRVTSKVEVESGNFYRLIRGT